MAQTSACPFFDKLPAELRLQIYNLALGVEGPQEVNLLEAKPPSKAILLTCKKVHAEARAAHNKVYRKYWKETKFVIPEGIPERVQHEVAALRRIKLRDLLRVNHLWIIRRDTWGSESETITFELLDNRGGWTETYSYMKGGYILLHIGSDARRRCGRRTDAWSRAELDEMLENRRELPIDLQVEGFLLDP